MVGLKTVVKLTPLLLPVMAVADTHNLTAKDNVLPFSPIVLPTWAWIVVGVGGSIALFKFWK